MTDAEHWGPWIEHDGASSPLGEYVHAILGSGGEKFGVVTKESLSPSPGKVSRWIYSRPTPRTVARYRIRKPRGLTILENLIAHIPQREDA